LGLFESRKRALDGGTRQGGVGARCYFNKTEKDGKSGLDGTDYDDDND
jgi:hypothetical protein